MRRLPIILAALAAATITFSAPAEAARRHHQPTVQAGQLVPNNDGKWDFIQTTSHSHKAPRAAAAARSRSAEAFPERRQAAEAPQAYPWPSYGQPTAQEQFGRRRSGLTARSEIAAVGHRSALCAAATGGLSCGCDTARYFGVRISIYPNGRHDLDLASNWGLLDQSPGPCVNCAAWRRGHVMAIIGGGPGAWRVRDFNSGRGVTHEYVAASFPGYQFAIPADLRLTRMAAHGAHRHHSFHAKGRHHGKRIRYAARRQ